MPKKRLLAIIANTAVGESTKKASWNKTGCCSRKVRKDLGGHQEEILSIEKFGGY